MLSIMFMTVILLGIRLVFRRDAVAAIAGAAFFGLVMFIGLNEYVASPWFAAVISFSGGAVTVIVYTRVGLLAAFFGLFASNLAFTPISIDLQTWYGGYTIFNLALVIGIAVWAGWVALAGQPLFRIFSTRSRACPCPADSRRPLGVRRRVVHGPPQSR